MGKDKTQTTTQTLDPSSQRFVDQMRSQAQGSSNAIQNMGPLFAGADQRSIQEQMAPFMNPYIQQVIGGLGEQFDTLRAGARTQGSQAATAAGAFNSSRHGVAEGVRLGEIDRAQGQQVGGLLSNQFNSALSTGLQHSEYQRALRERQLQEPLFRRQMQQQFMQGGLGPTGGTSTSVQPGNLMGDIAGAGLIGLSMMNPAAGIAAGAFGGGGGGFQIPGTTQGGGLFSGALPGRY